MMIFGTPLALLVLGVGAGALLVLVGYLTLTSPRPFTGEKRKIVQFWAAVVVLCLLGASALQLMDV